jgi:hypothetical protein
LLARKLVMIGSQNLIEQKSDLHIPQQTARRKKKRKHIDVHAHADANVIDIVDAVDVHRAIKCEPETTMDIDRAICDILDSSEPEKPVARRDHPRSSIPASISTPTPKATSASTSISTPTGSKTTHLRPNKQSGATTADTKTKKKVKPPKQTAIHPPGGRVDGAKTPAKQHKRPSSPTREPNSDSGEEEKMQSSEKSAKKRKDAHDKYVQKKRKVIQKYVPVITPKEEPIPDVEEPPYAPNTIENEYEKVYEDMCNMVHRETEFDFFTRSKVIVDDLGTSYVNVKDALHAKYEATKDKPRTECTDPFKVAWIKALITSNRSDPLPPDQIVDKELMRASIPLFSREWEEANLVEPTDDWPPCDAGQNCQGIAICKNWSNSSEGIILRACFSEEEVETVRVTKCDWPSPRMCVPCKRRDIGSMLLDTMAGRKGYRETKSFQYYRNSAGVKGEYFLEDCITSGSHVYQGMVDVIVRHQLNMYAPETRSGGLRGFRQLYPRPTETVRVDF